MLSIYWGVTDECFYYIHEEFKELYKPEWFDDPVVQEIIADIDTCQYVGKHCLRPLYLHISQSSIGYYTGFPRVCKGNVELTKPPRRGYTNRY